MTSKKGRFKFQKVIRTGTCDLFHVETKSHGRFVVKEIFSELTNLDVSYLKRFFVGN